MATGQQQFCVRWNSYQSNLQNAFPKLLTSEHFVDVTLACESEMIKCHKVVLSACSTYFEKLLVQNPCQHPIIFMKDMRFVEMQALVDFMYKGEVNVTQDELPSLLRSAEALQIRGLCGSDQLLSQHYLGSLQAAQAGTAPASGPDDKATAGGTQPGAEPGRAPTSGDAAKSETGAAPAPAAPCAPGAAVAAAAAAALCKREAADASENSSGKSEDGADSAVKDELFDNDDSYYDNDADLMDTEYLDQEDEDPTQPGTSGLQPECKTPGRWSSGPGPGGLGGAGADGAALPEYAMANVSCQYSDGSPGSMSGSRRIRRSEAELRRAAECITRGQTFQTVSDQFNIPISTIRFYMARKGILPRRKRGRACSAPVSQMMGGGGAAAAGAGSYHGAAGNTSPVGPPYHIVHYKLPALGAKLK